MTDLIVDPSPSIVLVPTAAAPVSYGPARSSQAFDVMVHGDAYIAHFASTLGAARLANMVMKFFFVVASMLTLTQLRKLLRGMGVRHESSSSRVIHVRVGHRLILGASRERLLGMLASLLAILRNSSQVIAADFELPRITVGKSDASVPGYTIVIMCLAAVVVYCIASCCRTRSPKIRDAPPEWSRREVSLRDLSGSEFLGRLSKYRGIDKYGVPQTYYVEGPKLASAGSPEGPQVGSQPRKVKAHPSWVFKLYGMDKGETEVIHLGSAFRYKGYAVYSMHQVSMLSTDAKLYLQNSQERDTLIEIGTVSAMEMSPFPDVCASPVKDNAWSRLVVDGKAPPSCKAVRNFREGLVTLYGAGSDDSSTTWFASSGLAKAKGVAQYEHRAHTTGGWSGTPGITSAWDAPNPTVALIHTNGPSVAGGPNTGFPFWLVADWIDNLGKPRPYARLQPAGVEASEEYFRKFVSDNWQEIRDNVESENGAWHDHNLDDWHVLVGGKIRIFNEQEMDMIFTLDRDVEDVYQAIKKWDLSRDAPADFSLQDNRDEDESDDDDDDNHIMNDTMVEMQAGRDTFTEESSQAAQDLANLKAEIAALTARKADEEREISRRAKVLSDQKKAQVAILSSTNAERLAAIKAEAQASIDACLETIREKKALVASAHTQVQKEEAAEAAKRKQEKKATAVETAKAAYEAAIEAQKGESIEESKEESQETTNSAKARKAEKRKAKAEKLQAPTKPTPQKKDKAQGNVPAHRKAQVGSSRAASGSK